MIKAGKFLFCLLVLTTCSPSARFAADKPVKPAAIGSVYREGSTFYGQASYYADKFHGRKTANGEIFNMYGLTAAHKELPFNTILEVTNLQNNLSVQVRVNDRGPFKKGRVLDLSLRAAEKIGLISRGVTKVKIKILRLGE